MDMHHQLNLRIFMKIDERGKCGRQVINNKLELQYNPTHGWIKIDPRSKIHMYQQPQSYLE